MLSNLSGVLPIGKVKKRVSRAEQRREKLQERKIFKRSGESFIKCQNAAGSVVNCIKTDKACFFRFDLEKKDVGLQGAGCSKESPPSGGKWGSGDCVAVEGAMVVDCFCADGDTCDNRATLIKKAMDKYYEANPTSTPAPTTTQRPSESTTTNPGGGPVPLYVYIVGGGLVLIMLSGGAYLIYRWIKRKKKTSAANSKKEEIKKKEEDIVTPTEEKLIIETISTLSSQRNTLDGVFQEAANIASTAAMLTNQDKSQLSANGILLEAENNIVILPLPHINDAVSFFLKIADRDVKRLIIVDFTDATVINLVPDDEIYQEANNAATGEASRSCKGNAVEFISKTNKSKAILNYGDEEAIEGMKGVVRRSLDLQFVGQKKTAKLEVLVGYAFRRKICNFDGAAVVPKMLVYNPVKTAILLPSLTDHRGVTILLSARLILDVKEGRSPNLKERLTEMLKKHPEADEYGGQQLKVTVAITLCALRQRVARSLPQAQTQSIDEFCSKTIIEMHDPGASRA